MRVWSRVRSTAARSGTDSSKSGIGSSRNWPRRSGRGSARRRRSPRASRNRPLSDPAGRAGPSTGRSGAGRSRRRWTTRSMRGCRRAARRVTGRSRPSGSRTKTRQSIVRRVHVTRFRVHIGHCVACGTRVQGRHPSQTSEATGAAAAQVGPEALAFAAILNQEFGLSYGKTVAVRQRGFGLTLTPGGLSQALARLAARCEPPDEHRKAVVRTQPSVTMDETGWRIGGHPAWKCSRPKSSTRKWRRGSCCHCRLCRKLRASLPPAGVGERIAWPATGTSTQSAS